VALGILLEVVPASDLEKRVTALASTIAAKSRPAVKLAKRLLRQARSMDLDGFLELSAAYQAIAHTTPEHTRAVGEYLRRLRERDWDE
jgi:enoyl-CoA hydratase/carnithine racemase